MCRLVNNEVVVLIGFMICSSGSHCIPPWFAKSVLRDYKHSPVGGSNGAGCQHPIKPKGRENTQVLMTSQR